MQLQESEGLIKIITKEQLAKLPVEDNGEIIVNLPPVGRGVKYIMKIKDGNIIYVKVFVN